MISQQVKVLFTKPDDLSLAAGTHTAERENKLSDAAVASLATSQLTLS